MESSSREKRRGIEEKSIAEMSSIRVRVREAKRANVVVNGDGGA